MRLLHCIIGLSLLNLAGDQFYGASNEATQEYHHKQSSLNPLSKYGVVLFQWRRVCFFGFPTTSPTSHVWEITTCCLKLHRIDLIMFWFQALCQHKLYQPCCYKYNWETVTPPSRALDRARVCFVDRLAKLHVNHSLCWDKFLQYQTCQTSQQSQFLSDKFNYVDNEYGGQLVNRMFTADTNYQCTVKKSMVTRDHMNIGAMHNPRSIWAIEGGKGACNFHVIGIQIYAVYVNSDVHVDIIRSLWATKGGKGAIDPLLIVTAN